VPLPSERPWAQVPAEAAAVLRPALPQISDEIIAALPELVPEYRRPLEGDFGRALREGVTVALAQFVDLLGRDSDLPDLSVYARLGRAQLREGRTLDALQSAYRVGARTAWRRIARLGVAPETAYLLAEAIFAYIDRLADASVSGFAQEQSLQAGAAQAQRHALVQLLARWPPADPAAVERAAAAASWPLPERLAAVAVGGVDPVQLARRMPLGTIGAALEPVPVLLVPDPDATGRPALVRVGLGRARAVLGPTVPAGQASRSVARAVSAWRLHAEGAFGDVPLVRADDHLLALLLAADPFLTADLVRTRLAPLEDQPRGVRLRAEATLRAWLDAHGDVSRAAEALGVHPQTVRYRLAGLRDLFGTALDDPVQRLEVSLALRAVPQDR
jgi:hypothetical protein